MRSPKTLILVGALLLSSPTGPARSTKSIQSTTNSCNQVLDSIIPLNSIYESNNGTKIFPWFIQTPNLDKKTLENIADSVGEKNGNPIIYLIGSNKTTKEILIKVDMEAADTLYYLLEKSGSEIIRIEDDYCKALDKLK